VLTVSRKVHSILFHMGDVGGLLLPCDLYRVMAAHPCFPSNITLIKLCFNFGSYFRAAAIISQFRMRGYLGEYRFPSTWVCVVC